MASTRTSTKLFRCDPMCTTSDLFVKDPSSNFYGCKYPSPTPRQWGDGLDVQCIQWIGSTNTEKTYAQEGRLFMGGLQVFSADAMIYVQGTFKATTTASSWVYYAYVDTYMTSALVYMLPAGRQVVGPPAYNR